MKPKIIINDYTPYWMPDWIRYGTEYKDYAEYRRKIEGLFAEKTILPNDFLEEVNKMNEPYMNRYCDEADRGIHFLFETDTWNGNNIKEMKSSHIINTILMLLEKADKFKRDYELFVIDNIDNKLLVPKDNIEDLAKLDTDTWIKTTPIFIALTKELATRKLLSYFEIVLDRTKN